MAQIRAAVLAMMCATIAWPAAAQPTLTTAGDTATETATIERLDHARRFVVLRGADGSELGVFAPPEFTRFSELRVGDVVTLTYYESVVYQVRSRHAPKPGVSEEVAAHERSLLDGVTRDDRVDITYTEALLATATRVK